MTRRKIHLSFYFLLFYLASTTLPLLAQPDGIKISQPWVLSHSFEKGLYKANLSIYGNELSGLVMMKKTGKSLRAVFMSEIGLKYFDIEVNGNNEHEFEVYYMLDVLNRKPVLEFMENVFRMITLDLGELKKEKFRDGENTGGKIKVVKTDQGKFRIGYHHNFGKVSEIIRGGFLSKKLTLTATDYNYQAPASIELQQKHFLFSLKQIEN